MREASSRAEKPLAGGIANLGKVVRVGDTVRRPASAFTDPIFALFEHLRAPGFEGVPHALGWDDRGGEVLSFIEGDAPIPPLPGWSMTGQALASALHAA